MGKSKLLFEEMRKDDAHNPVWGVIDNIQKQYNIEPADVNQEIKPAINNIIKQVKCKTVLKQK